MTAGRSKFAGGDQAYLRDEQYRDGQKLTDRARLHVEYRTAPVPWLDWVGTHLELFEGAAVLEAGCGTGWLWDESTFDIPPGVELTLTDLSQGMVDEAVTRAAATGRFGMVDGQPADLQRLPFDDASYDRVIANHMLYHLPDPARGVAELARLVRPGGAAITATNGREHLRELSEIQVEVFGPGSVDETMEVFNPDNGFSMLRRHFTDVRYIAYPDMLRCTDPEVVLAYMCSFPPGEDATPGQMAELAAAVEVRFASGQGVLTVTKEVGCFIARDPVRSVP